jgi:hypothetical protein
MKQDREQRPMHMMRITRKLRTISRSVGLFLAAVVSAGEPLVPRPEIVGVETADAHTLVLLVRAGAGGFDVRRAHTLVAGWSLIMQNVHRP